MHIARKNGLKAYSFSRGGMTAKEYIESYAELNGLWDKEKACQAYVIALGVNDVYNRNMEIGSMEDINKDDYTKNNPTFAGYFAQIVSRYKEISPDAKFFFVTIHKDEKREKTKLHKTVQLMYDMAEYFENSYIDYIVRHNPDDFKTTGMVGTDIKYK